jgi:hypothetical protein
MSTILKEVSTMKKIALTAMAACFVAACIGGCKGSIADAPVFASELQMGQPIIVCVIAVETAAGSFEWRATGIDAMPLECGEENEDEDNEDEEGDDDEVEEECEDGVTPDGLPCADDDDGEAEDDDEVEEECEDGVTPDGLPCADDDDGEAEDNDEVEEECEDGVTPDGLPCLDDDDEGEENEDEDDEECGDMESESFEMIAAPVDRSIDPGNVLRLMGIDVELPLSDGIQAAANVRFIGSYSADVNLFKATDLATTRSATNRLMTKIQSIEKLPDGMLAFGLFNVKVIVDPQLRVRIVKSLSQDVAEDLDGDLQCEQEGEYEGENAGCP